MKKRSAAPKSTKMRELIAKIDFKTRAKSAGVFVQKASRTKSGTKRQRSIRNRRTASGADRHLECGLEWLLHYKKEIAAVQWPRNPNQRGKKKMDLFLVLCKEDEEHKSRGRTLLHERRELLDGLLGGGRHCRQRWTWSQKPGLFCLFQLPVPPLLSTCVSRLSCSVLVRFLATPPNRVVSGTVLLWGSAPVILRPFAVLYCCA